MKEKKKVEEGERCLLTTGREISGTMRRMRFRVYHHNLLALPGSLTAYAAGAGPICLSRARAKSRKGFVFAVFSPLVCACVLL